MNITEANLGANTQDAAEQAPATPEATNQESKETETQEPQGEPEEQEPEPVDKDKLIKGLDKSLKKEIRKRQRGNETISNLQKQVDALESRLGSAPEPEINRDDYPDESSYIKAVIKSENEKQEAEKTASASKQARTKSAYDDMVESREEFLPENYKELLIESVKKPISPIAADIIRGSKFIPDIQCHLTSNPDVLSELNSMSKAEALRAVGAMESLARSGTLNGAKEAKPAKKAVSTTPKVGDKSAKVEKDPNTMSAAEFKVWYHNKFKKRKE